MDWGNIILELLEIGNCRCIQLSQRKCRRGIVVHFVPSFLDGFRGISNICWGFYILLSLQIFSNFLTLADMTKIICFFSLDIYVYPNPSYIYYTHIRIKGHFVITS